MLNLNRLSNQLHYQFFCIQLDFYIRKIDNFIRENSLNLLYINLMNIILRDPERISDYIMEWENRNQLYIPLEICSYIFEYIGNLRDQINYCYINKELCNNIKIKTILDPSYGIKITNICLYQNIFSSLEQLNISDNENVKDINHLVMLKKLICRGENSVLGQKGIKNIRLEELYCSNNKYINDINHMKSTLKYIEPNDNIKYDSYRDKLCGCTRPCLLTSIILITLSIIIFCLIFNGVYFGLIYDTKYNNYVSENMVNYDKYCMSICKKDCHHINCTGKVADLTTHYDIVNKIIGKKPYYTNGAIYLTTLIMVPFFMFIIIITLVIAILKICYNSEPYNINTICVQEYHV